MLRAESVQFCDNTCAGNLTLQVIHTGAKVDCKRIGSTSNLRTSRQLLSSCKSSVAVHAACPFAMIFTASLYNARHEMPQLVANH